MTDERSMFKYDEQFWKWGQWARTGGEVSLQASTWIIEGRSIGRTSELHTYELENKIEASAAMVARVDPLAAKVVRHYYVHAKARETQSQQAKNLGITLCQFKNKLRKARMRMAMSVFNESGM
ncbi:hypothetical protein [Pseudoalteromonas sp. ASV78]|uniref:hypothetical protein n=1 Tax=Pseudoalteromonas sp. ASV78 TaxID=3397851 RepID=UPI0039FDB9CC